VPLEIPRIPFMDRFRVADDSINRKTSYGHPGLYLTVEFRFSRAKITASAGLKALAQHV